MRKQKPKKPFPSPVALDMMFYHGNSNPKTIPDLVLLTGISLDYSKKEEGRGGGKENQIS